MKTKAEIIQRLLEEKNIDAEEAVILLMRDEPLMTFIPVYPQLPQPIPFWPYAPSIPLPASPIYSTKPTFTSQN